MKNKTLGNADKNSRRRGKRRGTARLFVLGAAFMASTTVSAGRLKAAPTSERLGTTVQAQALNGSAAAQSERAIRFDIPAGPLSDVLRAFERLAGVRVTLALDSIGTIQSPGLAGLFTTERALRELLMGTAVAFRFTAATQAVLELEAQSESVQVTAGPPTVQSPKYSVPLRDVAQTIAVVPREVFEEQGAITLSDVLRNVPGITLQAGEGGGASSTAGDMFNMRGFNASNSLFVDGVRDDGLISRDVFNLEQVEVFLGPTGADVGRGTAAGYVNMQSKAPHMDNRASTLVAFGSADQLRMSADANWATPQTRQESGWLAKSALRLNVLWQDSGVPGRDVVQLESKAVAPSVALGLGTPTRVTLAAQIVRQDNTPDYGIPGAAWREAPLTPTTALAPAPVRQSNYYGAAGFDYDRVTQDSYTAKVEHDVNRRFTLRHQTRYNRTHREAAISAIQNVAAYNATTNLVTTARQGNERDNSVVSNQTTFTGRFATGTLRHAPSLGVEYATEEQFAPTLTGLGTRAPVDIFNPNPRDGVTGFAPARTLGSSSGESNTIAFYAFDSVELNQRWQVSGGLRWEHYDTRFQTLDAAGVRTVGLEGRDSLISGKAGLLFRASDQGNVYLSYGTSATPPGNANFTLSAQVNNQNNPNVEPQSSTNLEVGSKWDVAGGRLSLNGAVFHTENENVIFTVDATAVPPMFNQDDGQIVNGVSLGALGRITDRWEILANAGYLDTELRTQNAANNGRRLTLSPAFSGSLWTTYRLPVRLTVGGGVRYTDSVWINAANTIKSPGYRIVDALAEYAVNSHLSLRLNVYNVTDELYIRNVNNNGGRYNPGQPRSAMLTANLRY
jgi:catecholate siderophore receptor